MPPAPNDRPMPARKTPDAVQPDTTDKAPADWATGDEPMTGAQESYTGSW